MSIKEILFSIIYRLFSIFPVVNNKVLFTSFYGKGYGDSPRYIAEELKNYDFEMYWTVDKNNCEEFPPYVYPLKKNGFSWLYHMATSGIWIDNCRKQRWIYKRKNQIYIQTWHGGTCLKKVEKDAGETLSKKYIRAAKHDSEMINAFVSASSFQTNLIRKSFWYDGNIIETGLPRSDIFYNNTEETGRKVRDVFGLNYNDSIILYAPTFRNNRSLDVYNLDFDSIIRICDKKWGKNYRVIVKLHPNVSTDAKRITYNSSVINGSDYPDTNELICASSIVITDYSSIMFEAMEIDKIVFLYVSDLSAYITERNGFNFLLEDLPFDLAETNSKMEELIKDFDYNRYKSKIDLFKERIHSYNDGLSSRRVVDYILNTIKTGSYEKMEE